MNLAVDFGNSFTKAGVFKNDELVSVVTDSQFSKLKKVIDDPAIERIIVCSVKKNSDEIRQLMADRPYLTLRHDTPLPFKIGYKTPDTLGVDRIAAIAGGQGYFPDSNCLVIDAGTCITYDLIDRQGVYLGGGISPGIGIRFMALHNFTARLPLVDREENPPLVGQTTSEAIQSGVVNGTIAEIEEIIRMYSDKFADLQIIICGGDAKFFEKKLKATIFVAPELVLRGLNRILLYNV